MSILAFLRRTDFSPERVHHELQSVADAEHRHAQLQHFFIGMGRAFVIHRGRSARQDNPYRRVAADFLQAGIKRENNRKHFVFADAARDQLRILRSEVEDNDGLGFHGSMSQIRTKV